MCLLYRHKIKKVRQFCLQYLIHRIVIHKTSDLWVLVPWPSIPKTISRTKDQVSSSVRPRPYKTGNVTSSINRVLVYGLLIYVRDVRSFSVGVNKFDRLRFGRMEPNGTERAPLVLLQMKSSKRQRGRHKTGEDHKVVHWTTPDVRRRTLDIHYLVTNLHCQQRTRQPKW